MIPAELFLREHAQRAKVIDTPQVANPANLTELPQAIRDAAKRGWQVFPILTGSLLASNADALIGKATSDLSILEDLPSAYPDCRFGLLTGPDSGVWAIEMREPRSAAALYRLAGITPQSADEHWDGITMLSRGATSTYAFFIWPPGALSMLQLGSEFDPSLILHGDCSWVPLPPSEFSSVIHRYINRAQVADTPGFLVDLFFEFPKINSGPAEPVLSSARPAHSGSLQPLRRTSVIGKGREVEQFRSPVAWRSKSGVTRRR